jgi:UDP-N-acetylglucosamine 2-epimerase (non-hydrolysing)
MIHVVLGTKAQLVKMAPLMVRMREERMRYRLISTGQHRATMQDMLAEFALPPPDVVLYHGPDVVSLPQMALWTARILRQCVTQRRRIFGENRRGIVLVHGDTFSTLLGALMGRIARLRVGHVESGLRSFNLLHPFPEELTRLITFRLSHTLYCPGAWAMSNVAHLRRARVDTVANTLLDTLRIAIRSPRRRDHVPAGPFGLVSLHRYENIFNRGAFERLLALVEALANDHRLLFVLHPPTEKQLRRFGLYERLEAHPRIDLRPRYTYFDFVSLLEGAEFVVTDGGSIQEESSYLGKPCLLMRQATERKEGLDGNAVVCAYDRAVVEDFSRNYARFRRPSQLNGVSPSNIVLAALRQYA